MIADSQTHSTQQGQHNQVRTDRIWMERKTLLSKEVTSMVQQVCSAEQGMKEVVINAEQGMELVFNVQQRMELVFIVEQRMEVVVDAEQGMELAVDVDQGMVM
jgi:hypothetical protein